MLMISARIEAKNGISRTIDYTMLIEGILPDFSQKMIASGAYTLVYTGTTNMMIIRVKTTIDLRKSNNAGG